MVRAGAEGSFYHSAYFCVSNSLNQALSLEGGSGSEHEWGSSAPWRPSLDLARELEPRAEEGDAVEVLAGLRCNICRGGGAKTTQQ